MKMLTVSLLVCAMMALTGAAGEEDRTNTSDNTLTHYSNQTVPEAEKNETVALSDKVEDNQKVKTTSTCPDGWIEYNNRCFSFFATPRTWADAEKHCQTLGGNLASVHSHDELFEIQSMILKITHGFPLTWLGGHDSAQEDTWFWSDGTRFDFTYWADGKPDGSGDCLAMNHGGDKKFDDEICSDKKPSVCAIRE